MNQCCYWFIFVLISAIYIQVNNGADFDKNQLKGLDKEELNVLEDAIKKNEAKKLSALTSSLSCENVDCTGCVGFEFSNVPHEVCLNTGLNIEQLGVHVALIFDKKEIFRYNMNFNEICYGLPKPLNRTDICLEAYRISVLNLPNEATICLRAKLTLILPLLSIDFNCLKYNKGRGLYYDTTESAEKKALIDINLRGGHPKVTFNNPLPMELIKSIMYSIAEQRRALDEMQLEIANQVDESIKEGNWWTALWKSFGFLAVDYGVF
uniref:Venom protein family 2 protein 1 n=1 Tax=Pristhesancus plagipennis TaxID=1955184 RepID=A0A1Q1NPC1_PRIPG|nr:venom protein family 2 protein 1 [Pristhesancus plagipennis]